MEERKVDAQKKKGFFARLLDTFDKKLSECAKSSPCCCGDDRKEEKKKCCS